MNDRTGVSRDHGRPARMRCTRKMNSEPTLKTPAKETGTHEEIQTVHMFVGRWSDSF